jgi:NADH-quinone oxidoreductase subunit L
MTVPLIVLAGLSIIGGYIGLPHALGGHNRIHGWLEPVIKKVGGGHEPLHVGVPTAEYVLMFLSVAVALAGIWLAKKWYIDKSDTPASLSKTGAHTLLYNKYWVDQIYDTLISQPIVKLSEISAKYIDVGIIDGFMNGIATFFQTVGGVARRVQTGALYNYLVFMAAGVVIILGALIYTIL